MARVKAPLLSVVIPAYNEEVRIGSSLSRIQAYFRKRGFSFEVVVVDDGSTDGTASLVSEMALSIPTSELVLLKNDGNRGKGFSVRRGMLASRGDYALLTDADLSTPIEEFEKLEREVIGGPNQIAFGSRDLDESRVEIRQSWVREYSGKLYNVFVRTLTGLPFKDTQCGFKLFDMKWRQEIFGRQQIERFGFDVELLFIARNLGLHVMEVPVVWRHDAGSKVRFVRDGSRMIADLLRVRRNQALGRYQRGTLD